MKTQLCLLLTFVSLPLTSLAQPRVIWEDNAPFDANSDAGIGGTFLFINSVPDPLASGRGDVAEVILGSEPFTNIHNAEVEGVVTQFPVTAADYGLPYIFSIDYMIPSDTAMDTNPDVEGVDQDQFWVQVGWNTANVEEHRGGFIGPNNAGAPPEGDPPLLNQWHTLTIETTVPADIGGAPVTVVSPLVIFSDNGFFGIPNGNGVDTSMYIDNIRLEILDAAADIPGDFDMDGDVDTDDFGVFVNSFQLSPQGGPPFAPGDFDEDGDVDTDDFGVFVNSFQNFPPTPGVAVPEPTSIALLALVAACGAARRSRG